MRSFIVSVLENNPAIKNPILTILSVPCGKYSRLAQRLRSLLKINATNIYGSTAGTFTFDKKSALRGSQRIHLASVAPTAFSRSVGRFAHFKYRHVDARSWRWLADDVTHFVASHDRSDADCDDSADLFSCSAGGSMT